MWHWLEVVNQELNYSLNLRYTFLGDLSLDCYEQANGDMWSTREAGAKTMESIKCSVTQAPLFYKGSELYL
jgi:hypothetical protein